LKVYVAQINMDLSSRFPIYCWNQMDDLGISSPAL